MEETEKKTIDIFRRNLLALLSQEPGISMRQLSQDIHASDSYIQKVLTNKTNPSFDKIDSLGEYFHLQGWELFYDFEDAAPDSLAIIQLMNTLPPALLPHVREYMQFLLDQYNNISTP